MTDEALEGPARQRQVEFWVAQVPAQAGVDAPTLGDEVIRGGSQS